ncbi:hypothetical protein ACRAWG_12155 [Methylobacterium sp. P31]
MRHFIIVLLTMSVPAVAAPAHRQPTPAALQTGGNPDSAPIIDPKRNDQINQSDRNQALHQKIFDAKMNKVMASICRGC